MRITHFENVSIALVALVLAAAFHPAGSSLEAERSERMVRPTLPDWFLPIWDAYDRDPALTPDFDFAALYSAELPSP
jgi:hypothetical protein